MMACKDQIAANGDISLLETVFHDMLEWKKYMKYYDDILGVLRDLKDWGARERLLRADWDDRDDRNHVSLFAVVERQYKGLEGRLLLHRIMLCRAYDEVIRPPAMDPHCRSLC